MAVLSIHCNVLWFNDSVLERNCSQLLCGQVPGRPPAPPPPGLAGVEGGSTGPGEAEGRRAFGVSLKAALLSAAARLSVAGRLLARVLGAPGLPGRELGGRGDPANLRVRSPLFGRALPGRLKRAPLPPMDRPLPAVPGREPAGEPVLEPSEATSSASGLFACDLDLEFSNSLAAAVAANSASACCLRRFVVDDVLVGG